MAINIQNVLRFIFLINIFRLYPAFLPGSLGVFIGGRFIDIVIVTIAATILLFKFSKVKFEDFLLLLGIPIFVLTLFYGASLFSGISMGYEYSTFSLVEFFRYSLTGLLGLLFLIFGNNLNNSFINKFWIYAILANLIFNIALLFVPEFQKFADIFISSKTKLTMSDSESSVSSYVLRSSGLFINPNWAGLFFNLALVYFIFSPKEIFKMSSYHRSIFIFFTIICIFMTGSRTGVILFLATFLIYFFLKFKLWSIVFIFFGYFLIGNFVPDPTNWFFLPVHYRQLLSAFLIYGDLSSIDSFGDRIEIWTSIYQNYILLRPSIGFGVTDSIGLADNQYIWMLASYGYIGTSLIFLYFIILLFNMLLKLDLKAEHYFYIKYVYISFILFLIAGLAGQFFNVTQLLFLWFMIYGIYLSRLRASSLEKNE
tara:strand:+ start:578 stop:1855 length:1278 start_codon:yes stop_codon:yes gene_type:complete